MTEHDTTQTVNGDEHEFPVESRTLLVHALRDELGYTGTNVGCETSMYGAFSEDGNAVKSCSVLAVRADGSEVTTVEGLAENGESRLNQESFREEHGLRCGYFTPGMMTATAYLDGGTEPEREDIRHVLKDHLRQCTGYQNVVSAVESAAEKRGDARRAS